MRPSYLARHPGGRFFIQMRSRGVIAGELSIPLIRASLRTSDSFVARQRLMKILVSVMEVVDCESLGNLCEAVTARLQKYNKEKNYTEDTLAERLAYETVVRGIINRLNAARYDHLWLHPRLVDEWMHFVEANVAIPGKLKKAAKTSGFEEGRHAAIDAVREGLIDPNADHPEPPQPKAKTEPFRAISAREKDSRTVIAAIKARAANPAAPLSPVVTRLVELDDEVSEEKELGWGSAVPEAHHNGEPPANVDVVKGAGFGENESLVDVIHNEPRPSSAVLADPVPHSNHDIDVSASSEEVSPSNSSTAADHLAADDAFERLVRERDSQPLAAKSYPLPLSTALEKFLAAEKRKHGDGRAESDVAPMINFMISLIGDKTLDAVTRGDIKHVNEALPEIPTRKNMPREHVGSLHERYLYAKKNGWKQLERLTTTTIKNRYHSGFRRFFAYLKKSDYWDGAIPLFDAVTAQNMMPLPRDKFEDSELIELVSQPLFTGCRNDHQIWTPGEVFSQNFFYWGFLVSVLTGMRTGEIGQLDINQIETDEEYVYFNLRPFDASKGRVAVGDAKRMKTSNAARMVPVHPLLINLGLLDRAAELAQAGCTRLFPDCEPYIRKDGVVSWSRSLTRSFQYVKRRLGWERADLQLYSTRHLMSHWIDAAGIAGRTKRRILGHASIGIGDSYGSKGFLDPVEAKVISEIEPPVVQEMRHILIGARERALAGKLKIEKPWLKLDFKNDPESHKQ